MDLTAKAPEKDAFAKFYFLLQGAGTLISWNAILNGLDYFTDNFPSYDAADLLPFVVNGAQVLTNLFMPYLGRVVPLRYRIIIPLIGLSALLVLLPIEVNFLSPEGIRFWIMVLMLFLLGILNNVYQGSMSGYVGQFPFKYISFYLMGTGLAGLIMNFLRAIAILALSNASAVIEIIVYFIAAGLILAACGIIHPIFTRSYFCRYYLGNLHSVLNSSGQTDELMRSEIRSEAEPANKKDFKTMLAVFRIVFPFVAILVITYIETFLSFPGVMLDKPTGNMSIDWKVVSMLAVFNLFDVVGKNIAQYRQYYNLWILCVVLAGRVMFNLFFIFQAFRDWAVFNTIWFGYINIALFGTTNGFMTTACFIMGPENVEGEKKEIAGFLSVFGLTTGITTGSLLAYFIYG